MQCLFTVGMFDKTAASKVLKNNRVVFCYLGTHLIPFLVSNAAILEVRNRYIIPCYDVKKNNKSDKQK